MNRVLSGSVNDRVQVLDDYFTRNNTAWYHGILSVSAVRFIIIVMYSC